MHRRKKCPMLELWDFGEPGRVVLLIVASGLMKGDRE